MQCHLPLPFPTGLERIEMTDACHALCVQLICRPPTKFDPADVGGVYITANAWLVPDDPSKPYDLDNTR